MATVLDHRTDSGSDAAWARSTAGAGAYRPRRARSGRGWTLLVGAGLAVAFAVHLRRFGSWVVDDAGISMAYAVHLAHGAGLVAQPGAPAVEAFSDPLWVGLLALTSRAGLLGGAVGGVAGYVLVVKGLALAFHAVVLGCLVVVIRRVLAVVTGRPARQGPVLAVWGATGLLLAANPSYVVWMGSGLENPLFAAEVAGMAALATTALPTPDRRALLGLGALAGAAALTRPDGLVYVAVVVVVALLADGVGLRARAALAGWGLLAWAAVFGSYLAFRLGYFGAWVPNTAVAKDQGLPGIGDLTRLETLARAYGWPLVLLAACGTTVAWVRAARSGNRAALRVIGAGVAILGMGVAAFVVLPTDWMVELRFLTPVWPLLSTAAVLGGVQLAALASTRATRAVAALVLVALGAMALPNWRARTAAFRASPTLPLCWVAARYGTQLEAVVRILDLPPRSTAVLLPDIGGVLLAADYKVVDLAGLADPAIARLLRDGSPAALADHVLEDVRPVVVHLHGDWTARSGLRHDPRFAAAYVDVNRGEDWVRRDAVAATADPDATLARLRAVATASDLPGDRAGCGPALFG